MVQKVLNKEEMRRLKEINSEIDSLRAKLKEAEIQKSKLMEEIYNSNHEVIDALPGYIQRGIRGLQITTDSELNRYLDGDFKDKDFKGCGDMYLAYKYLNIAQTRKERLMLFRGVGEKNAQEALKIIEEKGM